MNIIEVILIIALGVIAIFFIWDWFIHPYNKNLNPGQQTYLDSIEKAMQEYAEAWHTEKMAEVTDEGRKCLGCGTPLGDYCEQCQHLLES